MDNHHMIPTYGTYFGDFLMSQREDPYYQVKLTKEGHACQHDILFKVFGDKRDEIASRTLHGQANMSPEARQRQIELSGSGKPHPDQVAEMQRKAWAATSKEVILTHIATGEETSYTSLHEAARNIGGAASALCLVIKGDRKSHKGFTAHYVSVG